MNRAAHGHPLVPRATAAFEHAIAPLPSSEFLTGTSFHRDIPEEMSSVGLL